MARGARPAALPLAPPRSVTTVPALSSYRAVGKQAEGAREFITVRYFNDALYVLLTTFKKTEGNDIQLYEPPPSKVLCAADKDARGEDERPAQDYL